MPENRESASETLFGSRAARLLVTLFLLALAGVVAFSLNDASRRGEAEHFTQDTAVGDTHYFKVPFPAPATATSVLTWEGKAMVPASYEKVKIDDTAMRPVFRDPQTGLTLYRRTDNEKAGAFIKIDVGEYLALKPVER